MYVVVPFISLAHISFALQIHICMNFMLACKARLLFCRGPRSFMYARWGLTRSETRRPVVVAVICDLADGLYVDANVVPWWAEGCWFFSWSYAGGGVAGSSGERARRKGGGVWSGGLVSSVW